MSTQKYRTMVCKNYCTELKSKLISDYETIVRLKKMPNQINFIALDTIINLP